MHLVKRSEFTITLALCVLVPEVNIIKNNKE